MNLDRSWAKPAVRLAARIGLLYLVLLGGAIGLGNVFYHGSLCHVGKGLVLACPVFGVDIARAVHWLGTVAWFGLLAGPLVLAAIALLLLFAVTEWVWYRRRKPGPP